MDAYPEVFSCTARALQMCGSELLPRGDIHNGRREVQDLVEALVCVADTHGEAPVARTSAVPREATSCATSSFTSSVLREADPFDTNDPWAAGRLSEAIPPSHGTATSGPAREALPEVRKEGGRRDEWVSPTSPLPLTGGKGSSVSASALYSQGLGSAAASSSAGLGSVPFSRCSTLQPQPDQASQSAMMFVGNSERLLEIARGLMAAPFSFDGLPGGGAPDPPEQRCGELPSATGKPSIPGSADKSCDAGFNPEAAQLTVTELMAEDSVVSAALIGWRVLSARLLGSGAGQGFGCLNNCGPLCRAKAYEDGFVGPCELCGGVDGGATAADCWLECPNCRFGACKKCLRSIAEYCDSGSESGCDPGGCREEGDD
jgi:hypothetical protein